MLVFVDESGDTGLKLDHGSSKRFVVILVIFDTCEAAQATDDQIESLRMKFGLSRGEFHFNNMSPNDRKRFSHAVAKCDFSYFGTVVEKHRLAPEIISSEESPYAYTCGLAFQAAKNHLDRAIVTIDGVGTKHSRAHFASYLRKLFTDQPDRCLIHKVKMQESKSNNLLQLADMIAGAVARSYSNKMDADVCREILKQREVRILIWP